MNYGAESATARLWRDKAEIREQERNEARAQTKIAEEKVAILTAENLSPSVGKRTTARPNEREPRRG